MIVINYFDDEVISCDKDSEETSKKELQKQEQLRQRFEAYQTQLQLQLVTELDK